jgi:sugar-phosphatase
LEVDPVFVTGARATLEVEAVLFDLDGVLIDSSVVVEAVWRGFAARHGLDAERLLATVHGRRTEDTIRDWLAKARVAAETEAVEREEVERAHEVRPLAGLAPGSWAVVTAASRELATARLTAARLPLPARELLVRAEDVRRGKPDPEPYRTAAERLGVRAAECVVIEDPPAGIRAARRAESPVIGVLTTHPADQLYEATLLVDSLERVRALSAESPVRLRVDQSPQR